LISIYFTRLDELGAERFTRTKSLTGPTETCAKRLSDYANLLRFAVKIPSFVCTVNGGLFTRRV